MINPTSASAASPSLVSRCRAFVMRRRFPCSACQQAGWLESSSRPFAFTP